MTSNNSVKCSVNIEWQNNQGITTKKMAHKSAELRLIRSDSRDIFIEVGAPKVVPFKLQLKSYTVHNKFMKEGKASIKFLDIKCNLFISNAPPGHLIDFLRMLFIKMTNQQTKDDLNSSLRTKLLKNKPKEFDEISPLTAVEITTAKEKVTRTTDTTPSPTQRKRKLSHNVDGDKAPAAKKLYCSSPLLNEPLNIEQQEIYDACLSGKNIFFTGSAGTGKSYLLRKIISALPPDVTVATASTGVAACQIGGITLHQFAAVGDGRGTLQRCIELAMKNGTTNWRKCKHLVIDEISMVDGDFFEKIETVARKIRNNDKPFGGIQLILCGDFFQLPPVSREKKIKFCFQTPAWERCIQITYELKQVHRQNDEEFIKILNFIRRGSIPDNLVQKLVATSKQKIEVNGILATRLCSHTQDANMINESKLEALPSEKKIFIAEDSDVRYTKQIDQQLTVPSKLELKIGAQVMLLKNLNIASGLVNGARGVIKGFKNDLPIVQFRTKEHLIKQERWIVKLAGGASLIRKQIPLKLAWAFSIHKSQGLTLDCVELSLSKVFEAGQAYVALSRAQSLQTLRVLDFDKSQVWANPDVIDFYRNLSNKLDFTEFIPLGRKNIKPKSIPKISKKLLSSRPLMNIN